LSADASASMDSDRRADRRGRQASGYSIALVSNRSWQLAGPSCDGQPPGTIEARECESGQGGVSAHESHVLPSAGVIRLERLRLAPYDEVAQLVPTAQRV
jgi:hypothetical protein